MASGSVAGILKAAATCPTGKLMIGGVLETGLPVLPAVSLTNDWLEKLPFALFCKGLPIRAPLE